MLQVLVFDNCMGVVTGAVLERMGGSGTLCCSHAGKAYCSDAVRQMNMTAEQLGALWNAPLSALIKAKVRGKGSECVGERVCVRERGRM
jgi:hypothetical protein